MNIIAILMLAICTLPDQLQIPSYFTSWQFIARLLIHYPHYSLLPQFAKKQPNQELVFPPIFRSNRVQVFASTSSWFTYGRKRTSAKNAQKRVQGKPRSLLYPADIDTVWYFNENFHTRSRKTDRNEKNTIMRR